MYALKPIETYNPPSKLGYRFRRFLWSRSFWALKNLILPGFVLAFLTWQIVTSQSLRDLVVDTKQATIEWVAYLPGLRIDKLQITNATKLQEEEVYQALAIDMPTSIILIDREELREKMSKFDEIGDAKFRFGFNGSLYIDLAPRIPEMIYYDGSMMTTVDHEGHRVEVLQSRTDRKSLFVISGEGALEASDEALTLIRVLKPYASQIRGLVRMGARRWDIVLVNGARLMLPEKNAFEALSLILKQHQANDVLNRNIKAFDMRNPAQPILRLGEGAQEEMQALALENDGQEV